MLTRHPWLAPIQVSLMAQVMVTSSLMHASILSSGKSYVDEEAEAEFLHQCLHFTARYRVGHRPPAPQRTFEQHWSTRCESEWRWAFCLFSAGAMWLALPTPVRSRCLFDLSMQRLKAHTHLKQPGTRSATGRLPHSGPLSSIGAPVVNLNGAGPFASSALVACFAHICRFI
jgi:hypothetical protein